MRRAAVRARRAGTPKDAARRRGASGGRLSSGVGRRRAVSAALAAHGARGRRRGRSACCRAQACGSLYQRMDEVARQRLAAVIGRTVALARDCTRRRRSPSSACCRSIGPIGRRSAYLALLNENPAALERLLNLVARSAWLAKQIAEHPMLLDELLDARLFDTPPTREELAALLAAQLARRRAGRRRSVARRYPHLPAHRDLPDRDRRPARLAAADEGQRPAHRHRRARARACARDWHGASSSRSTARRMCGAADARGRLRGDRLRQARWPRARLRLRPRSRVPARFARRNAGDERQAAARQRAVLQSARAKARSFPDDPDELGPALRGRHPPAPERPRGAARSGMDGFYRYQNEEAWVWEHQALLRSRALVGSAASATSSSGCGATCSSRTCIATKLKIDVARMRSRMRSRALAREAWRLRPEAGSAAGSPISSSWSITGCSRARASFRSSSNFPDNVRQLEALERVGLVPAERCRRMKEAYLALRQRIHELALDEGGRVVRRRGVRGAARLGRGRLGRGVRGRRRHVASWSNRPSGCGTATGPSIIAHAGKNRRPRECANVTVESKSISQTPNAESVYEGHACGFAAALPAAEHVPLELPSEGLSADRGDGRGKVPLLQHRLSVGRRRRALRRACDDDRSHRRCRVHW